MSLVTDTEAVLNDDPEIADLLGIQPRRFDDFADLAGALLGLLQEFQGMWSDGHTQPIPL